MQDQNKKLGKCVIYARVSTSEQAQNGHSLKEQVELCRSYILARGGSVEEIFSDVVSGRSRKRAKLDQAIATAIRESARLVFWDIDRMGRHEATCHKVKEQLRFENLLFVNSPEMQEFEFSIRLSMAAEEARRLSSRTKMGLEGAKRAGKKLGSRKGCTISQNAIEASKSAVGEIARTKPENLRAKSLVEVEIKNGLGLRAIARKLNEYKFQASRGGQWSSTQVGRLIQLYNLKNET